MKSRIANYFYLVVTVSLLQPLSYLGSEELPVITVGDDSFFAADFFYNSKQAKAHPILLEAWRKSPPKRVAADGKLQGFNQRRIGSFIRQQVWERYIPADLLEGKLSSSEMQVLESQKCKDILKRNPGLENLAISYLAQYKIEKFKFDQFEGKGHKLNNMLLVPQVVEADRNMFERALKDGFVKLDSTTNLLKGLENTLFPLETRDGNYIEGFPSKPICFDSWPIR